MITDSNRGKGYLLGHSERLDIINSIKNNKKTVIFFDKTDMKHYYYATRKVRLDYEIVDNKIELLTKKFFIKGVGYDLETALNLIKEAKGYDDIYLNYRISYVDVDHIFTKIEIDTVQQCLNVEFDCDICHFGRVGVYDTHKIFEVLNLFSDYIHPKDKITFEESVNIMNLLFNNVKNVLYLEPDEIDSQLNTARLVPFTPKQKEEVKNQINSIIDYIIEKLNNKIVDFTTVDESLRGVTFTRENISKIYLYNSKKFIIELKIKDGTKNKRIELDFDRSTYQELVDLFGVDRFIRNDGRVINTVLTNKEYMNNITDDKLKVIAVSNSNIYGKFVVYEDSQRNIHHESYESFIEYIDFHENVRKYTII